VPVTLAQAKLNAVDDINIAVIDEFRKSSYILDRLTFDDVVNPAGGGATLTYGYQRLITQPTAAFRAINAEYTPQEVTKARYTVDLKQWGGSFQIDRVLAGIGATSEVTLQMSQKIKAARSLFHDAFINGDTGVDANSFDGLSKILTGTATEYLPLSNGVTAGYLDLSTNASMDTQIEALDFLSHVDAMVGLMDGPPDFFATNSKLAAKFTRIAALSGLRNTSADDFGRRITSYGDIPIIDLGAKPGSTSPIVGLFTRDADAGGAGGNITNLTDLYAVRLGLDGVHGVSTVGGDLVNTWLPDFATAGAVKTGEVEMGPAAIVVKSTMSAAVLRNIKVA
jgi:hypothetical protein